MGEPIYLSDYFKALKDIDEVLDVVDISLVNKSGAPYSELSFDVDANTSPDGRVITPPRVAVFELKYPEVDIRGTII